MQIEVYSEEHSCRVWHKKDSYWHSPMWAMSCDEFEEYLERAKSRGCKVYVNDVDDPGWGWFRIDNIWE